MAVFPSERIAKDCLREENLPGFKVSSLMSRYTIEVPSNKEDEYKKLLQDQYGAKIY